MSLAPVALFTYNRPVHTRQVIETLQRNRLCPETDLFIFSDGPKPGISVLSVKEVRDFLKSIQGFKTVRIIERETNMGLAANIIDGVGKIVNEFGTVIVLEDDLLTSAFFLEYMNEALRIYQEEATVACIHGYVYPVHEKLPESFFLRGADCWGWATWKRGWDLFEPDGGKLMQRLLDSGLTYQFDFAGSYPYTEMLKDQIMGKNNSWAIRWYASAFLEDKYTLYPGRSMISNIGGDGSGTNNGYSYTSPAILSEEAPKLEKIDVAENTFAYEAFSKYHRRASHPDLFTRIKRQFKMLFKS